MRAVGPRLRNPLQLMAPLVLLVIGGCGVSYPVEVKVEVLGQAGLEKAMVAVYVTTQTAPEQQDLPFETGATIARKGESVTAEASMVDGKPGHKLTIRILRNEELVASETAEDPGLTLTATWAPE
ncbi:MAG: hypothetical protein JSU73_06770 [candidate division WOR-3 bacterium]|nr:MAG: hypothetical protein JSU73_06770 [candidate division WOR-3 bacterium]